MPKARDLSSGGRKASSATESPRAIHASRNGSLGQAHSASLRRRTASDVLTTSPTSTQQPTTSRALETIKAGGVVPDPSDDAHVAAVMRRALRDVARKLGGAHVVPTLPASMEETYRATLGEVRAALAARRALGLPSEPADIARVLKLGINRQARAALEV